MGLSAPCALILRDKSRKFIFFKCESTKPLQLLTVIFALNVVLLVFLSQISTETFIERKVAIGCEWFLTCHFLKDTFHEMN